ncbi:hypothetical protein CSPAE12_07908, partial [Colletotrichum incanum]
YEEIVGLRRNESRKIRRSTFSEQLCDCRTRALRADCSATWHSGLCSPLSDAFTGRIGRLANRASSFSPPPPSPPLPPRLSRLPSKARFIGEKRILLPQFPAERVFCRSSREKRSAA